MNFCKILLILITYFLLPQAGNANPAECKNIFSMGSNSEFYRQAHHHYFNSDKYKYASNLMDQINNFLGPVAIGSVPVTIDNGKSSFYSGIGKEDRLGITMGLSTLDKSIGPSEFDAIFAHEFGHALFHKYTRKYYIFGFDKAKSITRKIFEIKKKNSEIEQTIELRKKHSNILIRNFYKLFGSTFSIDNSYLNLEYDLRDRYDKSANDKLGTLSYSERDIYNEPFADLLAVLFLNDRVFFPSLANRKYDFTTVLNFENKFINKESGQPTTVEWHYTALNPVLPAILRLIKKHEIQQRDYYKVLIAFLEASIDHAAMRDSREEQWNKSSIKKLNQEFMLLFVMELRSQHLM